jgi:4-hydroxybenzoyl-CoA thioesterase
MSIRANIPIRFGDEDHARIAYYPRIFHYVHVAFEEFFEAQGVPFRDLFEVDHVGFPLAHIEADFRRPLRMGDLLEIDVWVERVGERSATFVYRGRRRGDTDVALDARATVVCVDIERVSPIAIPERYARLFRAHPS